MAHAESTVHAEAEQALHVASVKIALQLNDDSQPLRGLKSLSNLLLVHVAMAVHVEEKEQAVHVVEATEIKLQSYNASHPLVITESLLYFPLEQVSAVHATEDVHEVQVALGTDMVLQARQICEAPAAAVSLIV